MTREQYLEVRRRTNNEMLLLFYYFNERATIKMTFNEFSMSFRLWIGQMPIKEQGNAYKTLINRVISELDVEFEVTYIIVDKKITITEREVYIA